MISNCVLNLLPDKAPAFSEMARVLRPGGRFCVSDIVATGELPRRCARPLALYVGCVAGALPQAEYLGLIDAAGLTGVRIAETKSMTCPTRPWRPTWTPPRSPHSAARGWSSGA